jgi:hypothetical protein
MLGLNVGFGFFQYFIAGFEDFVVVFYCRDLQERAQGLDCGGHFELLVL